ncbi:hypothetical protein OCU04_000950 [Sclerotinia nivalis]|uniref:Uncharacterized protein n=1 Tax=Sclerotinia nivalis TaxID=352851 RepID=A0A9X0DQQ9_9HELO|nr:hypothetical protein OCU04_000950 [Sclerotinia nivalis]
MVALPAPFSSNSCCLNNQFCLAGVQSGVKKDVMIEEKPHRERHEGENFWSRGG